MKAKRDLFQDPHETWTEEANVLAHEITLALSPIIERHVGKGFRTREIEMIIQNEVFTIMAGIRIDQSLEFASKQK